MQERLLSLDAFRGMVIAFMILVNTPGTGAHVYPPLRHAEWHGWTVTDVVFPSFVWIVGLAITLGRTPEWGKALRRAAIIYALGLFVYLYPFFDFSTMRVLGVLQRIAICYLAAVAIYKTTGPRGQVAWIVGLFGAYWALMGSDWALETNFHHAVDRAVLGVHNYSGTKTWDPEGIVSTLPSIATCVFGLLAGHVLKMKDRCTWLFFIGNLLLAGAALWSYWIPINKQLWTNSFVLLMAGLDFVIFAMLLWVVDEWKVRKPFAPFVILGRNAIAIYMTSELIEITLQSFGWKAPLYEAVFAPLATPMNASLLYAIAYVLLNFAIAVVMDRKGWYLRA